MTLDSKIEQIKNDYGKVYYKEGNVSFKDNPFINDKNFEIVNPYFFWEGTESYSKKDKIMGVKVGLFMLEFEHLRTFSFPVAEGEDFSEEKLVQFMLSQPELEGYIEV